MKLKPDKCYIIGWIDQDNQYHLDNTLQPCRNKGDINGAILSGIDQIKAAKETFIMESVREKNIKPGYEYYYLFDTFGAGLRDAPLHKYKKSYVNKNIFTSENKIAQRKLFNNYWEIDAIDWCLKDARCCFKIIPVKFSITETIVMVPTTHYNIEIK
jgi:hypothetical protein